MSKLTVAIICGGPSSEHEVSCVSGGGVLKGFRQEELYADLDWNNQSGQVGCTG